MNITICNLGPIKEFRFDLNKDLHLIVGNNNVGKSYAITIVYIIVKNFLRQREFFEVPFFRYMPFSFATDFGQDHEVLFEAGKSLKYKENKEISSIVSHDIIKLLAGFIKNVNNSISNTFGSAQNLSNRYSKGKLSIEIKFQDVTVILGIKDNQFIATKVILRKEHYLKKIKQNREPLLRNDSITIYIRSKGEHHTLFNYTKYLYKVIRKISIEVTYKVKSIDYLPASRSGLYQALSAFGQIFAELSKSRSFLTEKIEIPGISEPLSDYFLKLSTIDLSSQVEEDSETNKIAQEIEREILQGEVEIDKKTKRIIYKPFDTDLRLDLSSTSSMVSEISPIVSYLRYVLADEQQSDHFAITRNKIRRRKKRNLSIPKHLIIIEEPEAHLHPKIQIKLTEIFSRLVKYDFKLIITSHSNFIFNKINNLILEKSIPVDAIDATIFGWSDKGGTATKLEIDELGILDENFIDSAELLFEEKLSLIESMNKNDD